MIKVSPARTASKSRSTRAAYDSLWKRLLGRFDSPMRNPHEKVNPSQGADQGHLTYLLVGLAGLRFPQDPA